MTVKDIASAVLGLGTILDPMTIGSSAYACNISVLFAADKVAETWYNNYGYNTNPSA